MFTLYRIDYRGAPKNIITILDRPSVHTGTIFVTIWTWNAPIRTVIRSVSDGFFCCERALFNGSVPFLELNLVITLLVKDQLKPLVNTCKNTCKYGLQDTNNFLVK